MNQKAASNPPFVFRALAWRHSRMALRLSGLRTVLPIELCSLDKPRSGAVRGSV